MYIYRVPQPMQLYFFLLSFKLVNYVKLLCHVIIKMTRKSVCVIKSEILVRMCGKTLQGTKMHFPLFFEHARARNFSKQFIYFKGRSSEECMAISMLTPTAQRQKFALIFSSRLKMLVFRRSTSLGHMQMSAICFIFYWQPSLIE